MVNLNDEKKFQFPLDFNAIINGMEEQLIRAAMIDANGVACRAAVLLGLKRTTFIEKLRKMKGISYEKRTKVASNREPLPPPIWRAKYP